MSVGCMVRKKCYSMCNFQIIDSFYFKINWNEALKAQPIVRKLGRTLKHLTKMF